MQSTIDNLTSEKQQHLRNFTEERNQMQSTIDNLKNEKDQQQRSFTAERNQMQSTIDNLKNEKDQQLRNFTEERNQLLTHITNLKKEKCQILSKLTNLTGESTPIPTNIAKQGLTEERQQLINEPLECHDGWVYYLSSLYFLSNETKSWSESRQYCRDRGADLIIINNIEEQNAVESMTMEQSTFWIGLTYRNEVGRWKWVDDSELYSFSWQPDNFLYGDSYHRPWKTIYWKNDCAAVDVQSAHSWNVSSCYEAFKWICEKRI
ncbi:C-type lectin domain family 10 member A-like [Danio aesculapii]|uniref:C-type lectin domain family 10 member A-like n=1 Tax=Danio aesculapii TaxID=1142201 RepID=UPI0024BFDBA1|nr:C-type lectin domain family 10 member A-like [Danio aesculapii]